jgi:hypothetical protein
MLRQRIASLYAGWPILFTHEYVVPADDKNNARLIVSQIILDTLDTFDTLKLSYPKPGPGHKKELLAIRKLLAK